MRRHTAFAFAALLCVPSAAFADFGQSGNAQMEFLDPGAYKVSDSFWSPKIETWRTKTIKDVFDKLEGKTRKDGVKDDWFANFDHVAAGERANGSHKGPHFANGLVYESIRGASDYLLQRSDPELAARLNAYAARIAAAQATESDGYLNTHNQLCHPQFKWGENGGCMLIQHEIYNPGMLIEAGIHHWRATGNTTLLACAVRMANLLCDTIGPPPRHNRVPTHSGPEEAVVLLARLLKSEPDLAASLGVPCRPDDYLALVEFWMRSRGNHCGLPVWTSDLGAAANWISAHSAEVYSADDPSRRPSWGDYAMDRVPLSDYVSIEGHAVRATLLGCGLAALSEDSDDREWIVVAERMWNSMVGRKMYVTGGVGALADQERFGPDYFLPSAAYLETCAAIGNAFFSARMAEVTGDARYVDELERVLYNALLTAVSLDGTNYTYENPLESEKHNRWDWHWCPCCPPMFLKITGALPGYVLSKGRDSVSVNLYVSGSARFALASGETADLAMETRYPWDGKVVVKVNSAGSYALRLRVPGWAAGRENPYDLYTSQTSGQVRLSVNGAEVRPRTERGYVTLTRNWKSGDVVELDLPVAPRIVNPHPSIAGLEGRRVVAAGPVVYAFEKTDNPDWSALRVPDAAELRAESRPDMLGGVNVVTDGKGLVAIPYYAVANRGTNVTFGVWMKAKGEK